MLNIKTQSSRFESDVKKSDLKKQPVEETKSLQESSPKVSPSVSPKTLNFRSDNKLHNNASFNFAKFNEMSTEVGESTVKHD